MYHQITLRPDGPQHAVQYAHGGYAKRTRCGLFIGMLSKPVRRRFENAATPCRRCTKSMALAS